jgi:hypothetical protein
MEHAKTSFSTETFACAMMSVVQYFATMRYPYRLLWEGWTPGAAVVSGRNCRDKVLDENLWGVGGGPPCVTKHSAGTALVRALQMYMHEFHADTDHAMCNIQNRSMPVVQLTQLLKLSNKNFYGTGVLKNSQ